MPTVTTPYRPVGQPELDLIEASGWRRFPPRLDWQPIFYPVLSEEYAERIAKEWNRDAANGSVGYVTRFVVDADYLDQFEPHTAGGQRWSSTGSWPRRWTASTITSSAPSRSSASIDHD
ncbi:MAG: hypothetical protein QOG43_60 [Actinomycetota bacterium]|jgi:hypothetical protein|nr:hypothetical protein [Actinomycetota bacterium]